MSTSHFIKSKQIIPSDKPTGSTNECLVSVIPKRKYFHLNSNVSNFTEDSSVSSTDTNTSNGKLKLSTINDSNCHESENSDMSSLKSVKTSLSLKSSNLCKTKDTTKSSRDSNDLLDPDERVKVSNALSLEYSGITRVSELIINECPEIVKTDCSTHEDEKDEKMEKFITQVSNRSMQTLPVLILPIPNPIKKPKETKQFKEISTMTDKISDVTKKDGNSISSGSTLRLTQSFHRDSQLNLDTTKIRSRTNSEATGQIRQNITNAQGQQRKSTNTIEDNNLPETVWGDVYNDYAKIKDSNQPPASKYQDISGDYINSKSSDSAVTSKKVENTSLYLSAFPFSKQKTNNGDNMKVQVSNFHRIFELTPFDEIVKSYFNSFDRRIRAICSRMSCKILLFAPGSKVTNDYRIGTHIYREKRCYTLYLIADSKERVDKSLKCIQETFPNAFLSEKSYNNHLNDILNEEIAIQ